MRKWEEVQKLLWKKSVISMVTANIIIHKKLKRKEGKYG